MTPEEALDKIANINDKKEILNMVEMRDQHGTSGNEAFDIIIEQNSIGGHAHKCFADNDITSNRYLNPDTCNVYCYDDGCRDISKKICALCCKLKKELYKEEYEKYKGD